MKGEEEAARLGEEFSTMRGNERQPGPEAWGFEMKGSSKGGVISRANLDNRRPLGLLKGDERFSMGRGQSLNRINKKKEKHNTYIYICVCLHVRTAAARADHLRYVPSVLACRVCAGI